HWFPRLSCPLAFCVLARHLWPEPVRPLAHATRATPRDRLPGRAAPESWHLALSRGRFGRSCDIPGWRAPHVPQSRSSSSAHALTAAFAAQLRLAFDDGRGGSFPGAADPALRRRRSAVCRPPAGSPLLASRAPTTRRLLPPEIPPTSSVVRVSVGACRIDVPKQKVVILFG